MNHPMIDELSSNPWYSLGNREILIFGVIGSGAGQSRYLSQGTEAIGFESGQFRYLGLGTQAAG